MATFFNGHNFKLAQEKLISLMVEVFKTNVENYQHAVMLIGKIHRTFEEYHANFDLEDLDNILRVECKTGIIEPVSLINLLEKSGFEAEILPDEPLTIMMSCKNL